MLFIHVPISSQVSGCCEHAAMPRPYTGGKVTDSVVLDIHSHGYKQVMYVGELSVSLRKNEGEEK